MTLATYISLRAWQERTDWLLFYSGSLWALSILTRPVALLPLLLFAAAFLWRREFKQTMLLLLVPIVLIGSWSWFVSQRYDAFILTTTAGGLDIWVGNNPDATGGFTKTPEIQRIRDELHSVEFTKVAIKNYVTFLREDPLKFIELQWRKTAIYFSLVRPTGFWIHLISRPVDRLATLISSGVWTTLLLVGGIAGAWIVWKERKDSLTRLFLGVAFLQPMAVIPIIVETRYRYSLFPFLAILAAYILVTRPFPRRIIGMSAAVLLVFTTYDVWYNWVEIADKIERALPFI